MKRTTKTIVLSMALAVMLTGCLAPTKTVVLEYDSCGAVVKKTTTSESVIKTLTASTVGKTVIAWESGWAAYLSASTATSDDPTPTVKMFAGKTDKGMISALPGQQNWDGIAAAINATKYDLTVTAEGMTNSGAAQK